MKHIKLFEDYSLIKEGSITFSEAEEIFYPMYDYGLDFDNVYTGHFLSLGKDVVEDHKELTKPVYPGIYVRLRNKNITINDSFFNELQDCISHFESRCNIELSSIYFRTPDGNWFKNVKVFKNYLKQKEDLPFATDFERNPYKLVLFIDLSFKFNDDVKTFWTSDEDGNISNVKNTK